MVTKAKKVFFSEKILDCIKEPMKLWKCLKENGYSESLKSKASNSSLGINGNSTSGKKEVAEHLNSHFATIAKHS